MLGKLMRAEWSALWKPVALLVGIMLVAGAVGTASFNGVEVTSGYYTSSSSFFSSATMGLLMLSLFCGFLVWASMVALFVFIVVRFYRTMFTDQGYLTLTLPVTAAQLVMAKFLMAFIIVAVAAILAMFLCSVMMTTVSSGELSLTWVFALSSGMFGMLDTEAPGAVLAGFLNTFVMSAYNVGLAFAALSLGAWWAKRHKVAAAVGIYLGASWLISLVFSILDMILIINSGGDFLMTVVSLVQILIYAGCAVGSVLLAIYAVKNKVDLS